jgi:hypothetical protein
MALSGINFAITGPEEVQHKVATGRVGTGSGNHGGWGFNPLALPPGDQVDWCPTGRPGVSGPAAPGPNLTGPEPQACSVSDSKSTGI